MLYNKKISLLDQQFILFFVAAFLITFLIVCYYPDRLFIFQLLIWLAGIYFYRRNIVILVFLLFTVNYLYVPKYFFIDDIPISFHNYYQNAEIFNLLVILNILFFLGYFLGVRRVSEQRLNQKKIMGRLENDFLFWIFILQMSYALVFGIQGQNIFQSGGYGQGEVFKSTLHEYFIVFFFSALLFMNPKSKIHKSIIFVYFFIYCLKTVLYGGRIEVVQISIMYIFISTNFFKNKYLLFVSIIIFAYFSNHLIGNIRSNPLLIFEPHKLLSFNNDNPAIISSQFGDVNQSSLRILGLLYDGYLDFEKRVLSLITVIFGSIAPSSYMPDFYNLTKYKQNLASSGGGGLISAYSYVWLSFLGPILFGFFIGSIYRLLYNSNNIYAISYGLMVAISFPRWFAYYPVILFKFSFLIVVILFMYFIIRQFLQYYQK